MKINEITSILKTYIATVKVNGTSIKTSITAESSTHARMLLQRLYGTGNVSSLSECATEPVIDEATKTLTSQQLQVKALSDKAKQFTQQKKQLQAKQALTKAQEKMRQANQGSINETLISSNLSVPTLSDFFFPCSI